MTTDFNPHDDGENWPFDEYKRTRSVSFARTYKTQNCHCARGIVTTPARKDLSLPFAINAEGTMKLPRVILADDHTLVADALSQLLAPHCEIVATVADGHALLDSAALLNPDVVVADIAMPLLNGLEAGRQLKDKMPGVKLVFLTMNEDPELAVEAIRAGASAYVSKEVRSFRVALCHPGGSPRQDLRDAENCSRHAGILHSRSARQEAP
jgi:CheY-like chemotaxis protein